MNRVFIGFDHRQPVSYTVLQNSIVTRTDKPVSIAPIIIDQLPMKRMGLTPFTFSRFMVPWLCDYQGPALFLDIDMLVRSDIDELFQMFDPQYDVQVVRNHDPELGYEVTSLMLFNCARCTMLTPERVGEGGGLHNIKWTANIGYLPGEWNHLVGYDPPNPEAKLVHFTQGVPAFPETKDCEFAGEWQLETRLAMTTQPWASLMGTSKHAKPVYDRLAGAAE